ncbi:hypothetical protein FB45DRAFT_888917 [Roridomyces roridus]|uniref:Fork-head domain-containing protein n=1 Tax=Roridomyces roridus TaxID=1738132 RepID=A0AAD7G1L7_9AGAR|nr:hypothetical protein FB45DRAFT_888917 [Roridomyces roridus]
MGTFDNDNDHLRQWVHLDQDFVCPGPLTPDWTISLFSTPVPTTPGWSLSPLLTPPSPLMDTMMQGDRSWSVPLYSSYHPDVGGAGFGSRYRWLPEYDRHSRGGSPMSSSSTSSSQHEAHYQHGGSNNEVEGYEYEHSYSYPSTSWLLPSYSYPSTSLLLSSSRSPSPYLDAYPFWPQFPGDNHDEELPCSAVLSSDAFPRLHDAGDYLRWELGLPPGAIVDLSAVPEKADGRPAVAFHTAAEVAIYASPRQMLTLQEICDALADRFSGFRESDERWRSTIRHILSLHGTFVKRLEKSPNDSKSHYWSFDVSQVGKSRPRKRKPRSACERAEAKTIEAKRAAEARAVASKAPGWRSKKGKAKSTQEDVSSSRGRSKSTASSSSTSAPAQHRYSPCKARA